LHPCQELPLTRTCVNHFRPSRDSFSDGRLIHWSTYVSMYTVL